MNTFVKMTNSSIYSCIDERPSATKVRNIPNSPIHIIDFLPKNLEAYIEVAVPAKPETPIKNVPILDASSANIPDFPLVKITFELKIIQLNPVSWYMALNNSPTNSAFLYLGEHNSENVFS